MKNLRKEYKLLIGLGIVFVIVLIIVVVKNDYITQILDKQKQKQFISCHKLTHTKGIQYKEYKCLISDEVGNSYPLNYIEIVSNNSSIKKLNKDFKSDYDRAHKNIEYSKYDKNMVLDEYKSIEYKIYSSNDIVSLLVREQSYKSNIADDVEQYTLYNIDTKTHKILDDEEMKTRLNITRDTSSKIRAEIINMYATKYRYDYNNEAPIYRNESIDESVKNITYSSINEIYIDDEGNSNFIIDLFSPKKGEEVPYMFKIDKNGNISYEEQ